MLRLFVTVAMALALGIGVMWFASDSGIATFHWQGTEIQMSYFNIAWPTGTLFTILSMFGMFIMAGYNLWQDYKPSGEKE